MSRHASTQSSLAGHTTAGQLDGLARVAIAAGQPGSPELLPGLVLELAAALDLPMVLLAEVKQDARRSLCTLAAILDGELRPDFELRAPDLPCSPVNPDGFEFIPSAAAAGLPGGFVCANQRMDAWAALGLSDGSGEPIGLLLATSRRPMDARDARRVEAMLRVVGVRAAAEIERARTDEMLRAVALAVSASRSGCVFDDLVRLLATILKVDVAFIARPEQVGGMRILAMSCGGKVLNDVRYDLAGTPCATVLDQCFRAYPANVQALFPADRELRELGSEGYAGYPLAGMDGRPLGIVAVASCQALKQLDRLQATLKIFAVRAAAEIERLRSAEEQKKVTEDLQQRETQYRAIFEGSQDALFLWDAQLRIVDVNPAGVALYGHPREELVGNTYPPTMPQAYVHERLEMVRRALAGHTTHVETTVLRPNGTCFEADLKVMPFEQGGRPHALAVVRDISERCRRERELQLREEQYRTIFRASADALVLRDARFCAVEVNPAYLSLTGYSREEIIGADGVLTLADPALRARLRTDHLQALAGRELRFEFSGRRKDGSALQVEVRGTPMMYAGEPHVLYAVRDISERLAAEQRRAELERQLRQAQKMEAIGQLTGGLAHDFNNILTSVLGYIDMARERPASTADAALARELGHARVAAERARDHVAQLLAFSRPRRGERKLLTPARIMADVLQLLRPNLPSSIAVDCHAGAEDPAESPLVLVDPVQFQQVLLNLCINARDAIGEHGAIRLGAGEWARYGHCTSCGAALGSGRWASFEVADDGRGIAREVVDRMFEPFFTTKEAGHGTGMGLAMVHGIVHDHGGHVQVTTAVGRGSSFRVLIPMPEEDADPAACGTPIPANADAAPQLHGRVLLVEDEPTVSGFMQDLLRAWGLDVVVESDPRSAARRLAAPDESFALLLTDHTMPHMTGLALAREAHGRRPELPVLLYTGNAFDISPQELSDSGVASLLRKPIDGGALRPLLGRLLAARASSRA